MMRKIVAIILGNRINDDGSITKYQKERLEMAKEIDELFHPDYFILSGGVANTNVPYSEADKMEEYLLNEGFEQSRLIKENKSHSTIENAKFSIPIAKELGAEIIIVCTSDYHFARSEYSAMSAFINELSGSNIKLMTYTKNTNM